MSENKIDIYTDGGCSGNPGVGAWAFVCPSKEFSSSGGDIFTTNNKMELSAAKFALSWVLETCVTSCKEVHIYTDSQYVKKGMTEWITNWIKKNWQTASKKPVLNKELWQELKHLENSCLEKNCRIVWQWVKGHDGNEFNEVCHNLVTQEIKKLK